MIVILTFTILKFFKSQIRLIIFQNIDFCRFLKLVGSKKYANLGFWMCHKNIGIKENSLPYEVNFQGPGHTNLDLKLA